MGPPCIWLSGIWDYIKVLSLFLTWFLSGFYLFICARPYKRGKMPWFSDFRRINKSIDRSNFRQPFKLSWLFLPYHFFNNYFFNSIIFRWWIFTKTINHLVLCVIIYFILYSSKNSSFFFWSAVKNKWKTITPVLPFLAIYRQIRDFGHRAGDKNLGLAMNRQSPKIRDF